MIKNYILSSRKLLRALGRASYFLMQLTFRVKVPSTNKLTVDPTALFRAKSHIQVKGYGNDLKIGALCRLRSVHIDINGNANTIHLLEGVKFYENARLYISGNNAAITIGPNTTIGSADIFCGEGETRIEIGADCMLSRNIRINTSDFHSIIDLQSAKRINPPKNIAISDHVWVGNGVTINKGSAIGKNCVIASQSVVASKSYPPNSILAGIPAKVTKENISWTREKLPYS